ncbi:ABC transporter permease [Nocardioides marmoriginsengisoli]|uniref:ABC transporter permease n=1 Tax=Nocardioides marmoriginsengisoli TaxID=661483 RepID=A0A3N0CPK0_9ACTN|nr:ABC transporter permease [Nocardioides marmoriginsengisoli]RNL65385.1 ABC transporter permease [Nocardioides marmoriginsengisoli]
MSALTLPARPAIRFDLRARPGTVLALLVVAFLVLAALVPGLLTHRSPTAIDLQNNLAHPSWSHPFGTDDAGRDLYTRVVYGARESLGIGLGATALAMAVAILLGFTAGLAGGWVDVVITRALEVVFAFPVLLLALLLISIRGPSVGTVIVAVGLGSAPGYARMVRGQVRSVRQSGYVEAAGALGHRRTTVIRRHLFPNAIRPLVAVMTLGVGQSIVWASGLAFLGLGVSPPSSEWGALLDAGRQYITTSWWLEILPGLVIVLVALAVTSLGRTLQHRLEGAAR